MATTLASMFGQQPQTSTPATKYTSGNISYDPSVYQQAMANGDQFAAGQGWSGLDPNISITGAMGDINNPQGFYASRPLAAGDTRNGYEVNSYSFNPDGSIKNDPNAWTFQEYKPDGGWLRPALTWAAGAYGLNGIGNLLTAGAGAAAGGGLSGMDLAGDAATGTGNNIATAGSQLGGAGGMAGTGIPAFAQQPGYGQQFGGALADSSGASPYTGFGSEVGGTGLAPSQAGAATGNGFNFAGATPGSVVGTGSGLGIAGGTTGSVGAGLGAGIVDAIKSIPGASTIGNTFAGRLLNSVLGSGGVSTSGNLGSLFTNYNQYQQNQDIINQIKGIYSPTGDYAKYLENALGRRDAAAGRNSQYGPRLSEMMGRLAEGQATNLAKLSPFLQGQQGGLNGIVGAGTRLLNGAGGVQGLLDLFKGGSQGGMVPAPTTNGGQYIPNPEYNPVDDNWWTNPQAGP